MGRRAPVVLIAFKRPDLLARTMRNVSLADGAHDRDIILYIDGPRSESDRARQNEIVEIAKSYQKDFPRLRYVRREKNLGCRASVVEAITEVINEYGRAIVLEEDILISWTFFRYMDAALEKYEEDKRIWCINAFRNRNFKLPKSYVGDVYLHPRNMGWGWGTWKDRWEAVDFDMKSWPEYRKDPKNIAALEAVSMQLPKMLEAQYAGRLNAWDVQCSLHIIQNGLYAIEPRYALTKNIGLGGMDAENCTHCNTTFSKAKYYNFLPRLPSTLEPDETLLSLLPDVDVARNRVLRVLRKLKRFAWRFAPCCDEPVDLGMNEIVPE